MRGVHQFPVASAFPYYPKKTATTSDAKRLQEALYWIKDGRNVVIEGETIPATEWFVRQYSPDGNDRLFFNRTCTLVPVPRSTVTPTHVTPAQWANYDICQRLQSRGWAGAAVPLLARVVAVRSSREARTAQEDPPSVVEHRDSIALDHGLLRGAAAITLVDDVVSAGRNAMGAYLRLRAEGFRGPVALFTVAHTTYDAGVAAGYYGRVVWHEGDRTSSRSNSGVNVPNPSPWHDAPPTAAEAAFLT